ncbi:DUF4411 family protein [Conexibacter sp. JD483]|uniref:DUF4411 family protein n=1 Tax=unclassified Conexibacter TaxID=2627773 RepID=UPI00271C36B4|nr:MULTISPECIES: DUF4411 family protein [unclassified Conexibacter]MDO8187294.1 DUF4411 family protein [Conexibacter sp. CPCC 205706]MDO8198903.1 DUF4411 family protein [Conexibacter sp. CPCC 205762]MDR9370642.1 DUF4411 family protein [Conexibacter sp. JD483]
MIVLDTSALIGAFNAHYLPDSIKGFWAFLDTEWRAGNVVVPRSVYEELRDGSGGAFAWVRERRPFVAEPSHDVQRLAGGLLTRFRFKQGRDRADPFVIAEASVRGFGVATYEGMSPTGTVARAKASVDNMPDICRVLRIECFQPARAWRHVGLAL